jgi:tripartite-type tricarboxylate transporter receptor subunit TctC
MFINTRRKTLARTVMAALAISASGFAWSQDWPAKKITILVPQPAGAIQDLIARALGDELSRALKQPVVVDNRPSASQIIASTFLARSAPDGYTLMVSAMPNVIAPDLVKSQNYAGNQDFTVISHSLSIAGLLTVSPQIPANNLKEFIALLKAHPDKYMFASAGVGTPLHMFLEQFNRDAGTVSVHVPYKSFPMIVPDITTNTVHYSLLPTSVLQLAKDGKVKVLGFAGPKRDPQMPDMPTLDEQGLKGFNGSLQYFVIGPKGMPVEIVNKLNAVINVIQAKDAYQAKYKVLGGFIVPQNVSPAQAAANLKQEDERYSHLLKEGKIKFE